MCSNLNQSVGTERKIDRPIRIGFLPTGDGQWQGGVNYLRTMLENIEISLADEVEARLFAEPDRVDTANKIFGDFLDIPPIADARVGGAGVGRRAIAALATGTDRPIVQMMQEHEINLVFETARFFGWAFPFPTLSWIPDFQHRYLPQLFSRRAWWKREMGFQAQTRAGRHIMLSSFIAKADCERFYPHTKGRTHAVRFAPAPDLAAVRYRQKTIRTDYALPLRFFFMPNQFWAHKNHRIVLDALIILRERGQLDGLPPIVMTGPTNEPRDSKLHERLLTEAKEQGVDRFFRYLGLIPMADVLALNGASLALVNPSLFEGWASSVEEAKALGTRLVLSDIPVHREQAPEATFFAGDNFRQLADRLLAAAKSSFGPQPSTQSLQRAMDDRRADFANSLRATILKAVQE